jgi:hypothetical protein
MNLMTISEMLRILSQPQIQVKTVLNEEGVAANFGLVPPFQA